MISSGQTTQRRVSTNAHVPTKGERTGRRLFEAAVRRFRTDGYEDASLRKIARDAGVTPALLYRYFESKEAIVGELYATLAQAWAARASGLPAGTWSDRVANLTRLAFETMGPYREVLGVLAPAALRGDASSPFRSAAAAVRSALHYAVIGAVDAPTDEALARAVQTSYIGHMACFVFWTLDRSPGQRATSQVLAHAARLAPLSVRSVPFDVKGIGDALRAGLAPST